MVPAVHFKEQTRKLLHDICPTAGFIELMQDLTARFLLEQETEDNRPTSADYAVTLDDLERVTSAFLDRLDKLGGHELQSIIDSAWYDHAKELPGDSGQIYTLAWNFRRQVWLAQRVLPEYINISKPSTANPIREFMANCCRALERHGIEPSRGVDGNLMRVASACLDGSGRDMSRYEDSLRKYLPGKKSP